MPAQQAIPNPLQRKTLAVQGVLNFLPIGLIRASPFPFARGCDAFHHVGRAH
jgi:hypothetical protein